MCLSAMVVARSLRPRSASIDPKSYFISSLTTGRAFATSPCGAREEERKRTGLSSSRKRAHIQSKMEISYFYLLTQKLCYVYFYVIYFFEVACYVGKGKRQKFTTSPRKKTH